MNLKNKTNKDRKKWRNEFSINIKNRQILVVSLYNIVTDWFNKKNSNKIKKLKLTNLKIQKHY